MKLGLVAPVPPPYGGISNWVRMVSTYINDGKIKEIELTCINSAPRIRKTEGRNLWNRIIDSGLLKKGFHLYFIFALEGFLRLPDETQ